MATVTVDHASPRFSVVIPAHGEAAVGRCLQSFVPGLERGEAEVVVVAYGHDATAAVAAGHPGVTVVDLKGGTRASALNVGDAATRVFPRLYLDPSAVVSVEGLRLLADALTAPGPRVAVPVEHVTRDAHDPSGAAALVKAYYAVADGLGHATSTPLDHTVYGLSALARARFEEFPDDVDDRLFIHDLFRGAERAEVREAAFEVDAPRGVTGLARLIDLRTRDLRAAQATADATAPASARDLPGRLAETVRAHPGRLAEAAVYAGVETLAHLRASGPAPMASDDARDARHPAPGSHVVVDGVAFDRVTELEVIDRVLGDLARGRGGLLLTPNVDIMRQLRRPANADLAGRARLVVADGTPIVWASRVLGDPLPERVTGASLIWSLSGAAAAAGHQVMLVGGDHGVAERAAGRLEERHPDLRRVPWHFPPFGFDVEEGGLDKVIEAIAAEQAAIVFLGLGFPRQERLAVRLAQQFPGTWFVGWGGNITMLAGDRTRAPQWMQTAGLEWFHRMVQEPRRLFRRYLVDDVPFALGMLARACGERVGRGGVAVPATAIPRQVREELTTAAARAGLPGQSRRPGPEIADVREHVVMADRG